MTTQTNDLPPDLAAALEVAKQSFTGIEQLILHSPRDIAEVHLATVLRDYLSLTVKPLIATINTLTVVAEELKEANESVGADALDILSALGNARYNARNQSYVIPRDSYDRAIDLLHQVLGIEDEKQKETGE